MTSESGAHPRLRGEHKRYSTESLLASGSSPLTRGARLKLSYGSTIIGLIPAYAGSTRNSPTAHAPHGAHPRLRGEHQRENVRNQQDLGSSPLTRGALRVFS